MAVACAPFARLPLAAKLRLGIPSRAAAAVAALLLLTVVGWSVFWISIRWLPVGRPVDDSRRVLVRGGGAVATLDLAKQRKNGNYDAGLRQ